MLDKLTNIGDETYQSWDDEQRRKEIGNLVQGFKNGLPIQILCQLATSIAGSPALAKEHIAAFLTLPERKAIIKNEATGSKELRTLLKATLL
jgi:hypothetical protein